MEFGYCTGFSTKPHFLLGEELLPMIQKAGFDYVEFPLMNFYGMSDDEFNGLVRSVEKFGLKGPAACNFFPGNIRLVGSQVDYVKIRDYLDVVLERCNRLGICRIILGSGPARTFGADQTRKQAFSQFADLIGNVILPETKKYSMTVCIEPFERTYCNLIVSVPEGVELVRAVGDPGLRLMVDIYHMLCNGESSDCLEECFGFIDHVHVAGSDRRVPSENDVYVFDALHRLGSLGYDGSVSFETELPSDGVVLSDVLLRVKKTLAQV